jgi:hypothetical protein
MNGNPYRAKSPGSAMADDGCFLSLAVGVRFTGIACAKCTPVMSAVLDRQAVSDQSFGLSRQGSLRWPKLLYSASMKLGQVFLARRKAMTQVDQDTIVYEPPMLVEAGDFAELTRGSGGFDAMDSTDYYPGLT